MRHLLCSRHGPGWQGLGSRFLPSVLNKYRLPPLGIGMTLEIYPWSKKGEKPMTKSWSSWSSSPIHLFVLQDFVVRMATSSHFESTLRKLSSPWRTSKSGATEDRRIVICSYWQENRASKFYTANFITCRTHIRQGRKISERARLWRTYEWWF